MQNKTFFLVSYIGRYDISSQQNRQIQAYHRKTYCDFNVTLYSRKRNFCHTKMQTIIIKVVFFQVLIFDSKLDTLPKTYQGGTNYIKSPLKLLITSSFYGQQLVFLENQIIFYKFHMPLSCYGNKLAF